MELVYLNYKEPLTKIEEGYGYYGTIAQTPDKKHVQCHICGTLAYNLGSHIHNSHGLKAKEYRQQFKLAKGTPLCSDQASHDYKERALKRYNGLSEIEKQARVALMQKARESRPQKTYDGRSLEDLNKDGMCPDQLISHIKACAESLQKNPTHQDFKDFYEGKYVGAIVRTFGSWNNAKRQADLEPNKSGSRTPWNKGQSKYTNEMLLEYLRNHYQNTGLPPTASDWKRGFLPDYHIYLNRFGSIKEARKLAGIPVENSLKR